jgi:hypothetical protein
MGLMDADGFITFVDVGNLLTSSHTLGGGIPPSIYTMVSWLVVYLFPSEKYEFVNGKHYPIYEMDNERCLKPPISHYIPNISLIYP